MYRAKKCLPLGNYIFTINDSYGDGLGTVNGDGTYLFYKPFGFYEVNVDGVTTISGGKSPFCESNPIHLEQVSSQQGWQSIKQGPQEWR